MNVTDALNNVTEYFYDARDRRYKVRDRLHTQGSPSETIYGFDANNNVTAITDREGNKTLYFYDERNFNTKITYPDHVPGSLKGTSGFGITYISYDPARRLKVNRDQKNESTAVRLCLRITPRL